MSKNKSENTFLKIAIAIPYITIGLPMTIFLILNEVSEDLADKFLSVYIRILPLPDGVKMFFVKYPAWFLGAFFLGGLFLFNLWNPAKKEK